MTTYKTTGTCARAINYEVENGILTKCQAELVKMVEEL